MLFKDLLSQFTPVPWRGVFEHTKSLKRFLIRIALVATGLVNREVSVVCHVIAKRVLVMYRKSGPLSTALYLKQCGVSLQRYYAGIPLVELNQMTGASVALSRAGIPTIIPVHHRQIIAARGDRGDGLVRLYLSLFTVCRIRKLAKPVSRSTFNSITEPVGNMGLVKEVISEIKESARKLLHRYLPWLQTYPLEPGFRFEPTWKSTPNDDRMFLKPRRNVIPNGFTSLKYEIAAFAHQLQIIHPLVGIHSPGVLFKKGHLLFPFDNEYNTWYVKEARTSYDTGVGQVFQDLADTFGDSSAGFFQGRLAQSLEGAGKRRLFVIGNYVKQRLLRPVHDWAMAVLRSLPTDGTYHQMRPIRRLAEGNHSFYASYDLSSATDRWPVPIIHELVACIFGQSLASCIVNSCLALNVCSTKNITKVHRNVCFIAGQPLGYYSSWALFSLAHHFMVWLAADKVVTYHGIPFRHYALLGDDIVIADRVVAVEYRNYLDQLQVKVSDTKSIVSDRGAFEFAKQFWVNGKNLSPVSAKAVLSSYSTLGVSQITEKYALSRKTMLKLGGAGFRVKARMDNPSKLSIRYRRLSALFEKWQVTSSGLPLEWWLGRSRPLSPFLRGILIARIRSQLKLKQLQLVPEDRFGSEGEIWTTESQMYYHWLSDWLKYLKWYTLCLSQPDITVEELLSPPIVSFTWKRKDDEVLRFRQSWSILYRLYDICEGKSPGWCPPCLVANWPALPERCYPSGYSSQSSHDDNSGAPVV